MSLDHDDQNIPGLSDTGNHAEDAGTGSSASNRKALTRDYDAKIQSLMDAIDKYDYRNILTYHTICAAIILLDEGEKPSMVVEMLRLVRDSMKDVQVSIGADSGVSHG